LYPNPTNGEVHIMGMEVAKVQVYNTIGQMIKTFGEGFEINLSNLTEGLYFLHITDKSGSTTLAKIIVK
ncbi:MAG: T9SS type A sorting domain-containing protein, partial [Paludibacteraceae bacterium]|nr:T9SS type A sorting domain-containing protein [Paludibacteraceae bacterium]